MTDTVADAALAEALAMIAAMQPGPRISALHLLKTQMDQLAAMTIRARDAEDQTLALGLCEVIHTIQYQIERLS